MKKLTLVLLLLFAAALGPAQAQSVQIKRGPEANIPALLPGQLAFSTDTHKLFVGQLSGGNYLITASGAAGGSGAVGSQIYVGAGVPLSTLGANGDLDINSATDDVYKKAAGAWGSPVANLKGSTGLTGATGPQGATGPAGAGGSTNVFISPVSGYQAILAVAPGYQLGVGNAAYVSAPLLTDRTSGDSTSGYKGTSFAAAKPTTIAFQSGNSIASGIIAAWPISEASGTTVRDISGNNLGLSFQGTAPTWATGPGGTVLTFGGAGSVTTPDNALLKPAGGFTFSGYANFAVSQPSGNARIYRKLATTNGSYMGTVASGGTYQTTSGTAYSNSFAMTSYQGSWHLYTITINTSTNVLTYYIDGVSIGTTPGSGTLTWDTDPLYLMGRPGGSDYAVGSLDVCYEWSRALSAAEVASLASNPYQLIGTSAGGTSITALLDTGILGSLPVSTIKVTRTWSQQLAEVLEYSSNGTSWTAIPTGYTPASNGGTAASLQTTVTLGTAINARYLRYSGKDSGSGAQLLLTDFTVQ